MISPNDISMISPNDISMISPNDISMISPYDISVISADRWMLKTTCVASASRHAECCSVVIDWQNAVGWSFCWTTCCCIMSRKQDLPSVSAACLGSSLQLLPRPLGYMLSTTKLDNVLFNLSLWHGQYVECVFLGKARQTYVCAE